MKKAFMIQFELPERFTEDFMALIPQQRLVVNQLLLDGIIKGYSLSLDRSKLWAVIVAESEFEVLEILEKMPLSDYMVPTVNELMFHDAASTVMEFSLN